MIALFSEGEAVNVILDMIFIVNFANKTQLTNNWYLSELAMFRGPQILNCSSSLRSLLLLRDFHLSAFSEHAGAIWQGTKHVKERKGIPGKSRSKEESSLSTETVSCSTQLCLLRLDCDYQKLTGSLFQNLLSKAISSSHHQSPQIFASEKAKQASYPWKWTKVEDLVQNPKAVSTYCDCLMNTTCLQPWRRSRDLCPPSLSLPSKTQCSLFQSHPYYRQHSVRTFSSSTHMPQILNHYHSGPQTPSFFFQHTKAIHQVASYVVDAWRNCLSLENENRCRQSLGLNLKFYEMEKGKQDTSQSQGKNRETWASVLVSLCSVGGEPSFLFTLRSSTLKGRHKGDVSFAGGKSDPSDRGVVATALREAREELGINVTAERVWGVLKPLRDRSGMLIAPVLANLGPVEELSFKPNPGEVEEIFTLTLSHLCSPQNRGYTHFRTGDKYGYTLPVFRNGKHRVWGLTAVVLDHTLKLIVLP